MKKWLCLFLILIAACEPELPHRQAFPVLRTLEVTDIDETGATFRAEVVETGREITSYGFVWDTSTSEEPTRPNMEVSRKIVVGENIGRDGYSIRIDRDIASDITFRVRAFATYDYTVVYGNPVTFKSKGGAKSPWSRVVDRVLMEGWFQSVGFTNGVNGYIMNPSKHFYTYDVGNNEILHNAESPINGNSGTQYCWGNVNGIVYVCSNVNRTFWRFENNTWTAESTLPFSMGFPYGYHGHSYNGKFYMLSSQNTYVYDPALHSWQQKSKLTLSSGFSRAGVSIGDKAYIFTSKKEIWEYDPAADAWKMITTYPGAGFEYEITAFALGNSIYVGLPADTYPATGRENELWSYDLSTNTWTSEQPFPVATPYHDDFYFTINGIFYYGHGIEYYDIYTFDPSKR